MCTRHTLWFAGCLLASLVVLIGCPDRAAEPGGVPEDAGIDAADIDPDDPLSCVDVDCPNDQTCYRGDCFPVCDEQTPCEDSERCHEGRCTPDDCQGVACYDDETCYHGVCYPVCEDREDCEHGESCHEGACIDELCDGIECFEDQTCYRGVCYDSCTEQTDCDDEHRCADAHCAPVDCEGLDCQDEEICYRGVCYAACQETDDCKGDGEICQENACIDPSCNDGLQSGEQTDVDCGGPNCDPCQAGENCQEGDDCISGMCDEDEGVCQAEQDLNACDGVEPLDAEPGEACGPCLLDEYQCDGSDDVVCDGETPCLAPDIDVEDVNKEAATFRGELDELPAPGIDDHGFCYATDPDPETEADNCESLGDTDDAGEFSSSVDDLQPGTKYWVRAFAEAGDDIRSYSDQVTFSTRTEAPGSLTTINEVDYVTVSWLPVQGAEQYVVYRDGDQLTTVGDLSIDDDTADPGDGADDDHPAGEPQNFEARDGAQGVELTWEHPEPDDGQEYDYQVSAINADGLESEKTNKEPGRRIAAPIVGWRVDIGDNGTWEDIPDGEIAHSDTVRSWNDETAPGGQLQTSNNPTIGQADHVQVVPLNAPEATSSDGAPVDYRLQAVTDGVDTEVEGDTTDPDSGRRVVENIDYQWEVDDGDGFAAVADCSAGERDCHDTDGVTHQDGPYSYRLQVTADGVDEPVYSPDEDGGDGWIATNGEVDTLEPTGDDVGYFQARLSGEVVAPADPGPADTDDQGFCYSSNNNEPDHDDECVSAEQLTNQEGEKFERQVDDLSSSTTYYVRAFVRTDADEATFEFGDTETFTTNHAGGTVVAAADNHVYEIAPDGETNWTYSGHDVWVRTVDVDSSGAAYTGASDNELHKISSTGNYIWSYTRHSGPVNGVAIGGDGHVYSGAGSPDQEVHKIKPDGSDRVWDESHWGSVRAVAVDNDDYVYTGTSRDDTHVSSEVRKFDSTGSTEWRYTEHDSHVTSVKVDSAGYVYSGSVDQEVHRLTPSGFNEWEYTKHDSSVNDIALDGDGNVYTASNNGEVHKVDSNGENVWKYTEHDDQVESVAVDSSGFVYAGGRNEELHKLDPDGNEVWTEHLGDVVSAVAPK